MLLTYFVSNGSKPDTFYQAVIDQINKTFHAERKSMLNNFKYAINFDLMLSS